MKPLVSLLLSLLTVYSVSAQEKLPPLDKSPLDISYCPAGYALNKASGKNTEPLVARVIYSRPGMNGRKIFGSLVEYNAVWRLGANEATEIEFYRDVMFGGKKLKKGRYTLFAIPAEKKWTFIINKETDTWGAFTYDSRKDVMRLDAPVENMSDSTESFTIYFEKLSGFHNQYVMNALWENTKVSLPISLVK